MEERDRKMERIGALKKRTLYSIVVVIGALFLLAGLLWGQVQQLQTLADSYRYATIIIGFLLVGYGYHKYRKVNKKYAGLKAWRQKRGLKA